MKNKDFFKNRYVLIGGYTLLGIVYFFGTLGIANYVVENKNFPKKVIFKMIQELDSLNFKMTGLEKKLD